MLGVSESKIRLVDLTRHRIENHQENYLWNVKRNKRKNIHAENEHSEHKRNRSSNWGTSLESPIALWSNRKDRFSRFRRVTRESLNFRALESTLIHIAYREDARWNNDLEDGFIRRSLCTCRMWDHSCPVRVYSHLLRLMDYTLVYSGVLMENKLWSMSREY